MKRLLLLLLALSFFLSCSKDGDNNGNTTHNLTIFFVADQHGQLENFAKIKHIVDLEKQKTNVLLVCSGDIFSGNPVVDNYPQKGFPIIDVMNKVGFNISVLGNHEFDYGEAFLKDRMEQADFPWVCANVDMGSTGIPEPLEYSTLSVGDLKVTFLGLVETYGKQNATIPATHPWRVQNLTFEKPEDVVTRYAAVKDQEDADLYIALSHMGHLRFDNELADFRMAADYPYFDLIIGGHTNLLLDTVINNTPVFQAGNYLSHLGKIELTISDESVSAYQYKMIDLNAYSQFDLSIANLIQTYNTEMAALNAVIGFSEIFHTRSKMGCFYTDALRGGLNVDVCLQNPGGVRTGLDQGDVTEREIYEISPFNNGTVVYNMTVADIKNVFTGTGAGFYYSGIQIDQVGSAIEIKDLNGTVLPDNTNLTIGLNDFIPAIFDVWFPPSGTTQPLTDAETIISYMQNGNGQVNYPGCSRYFRYE